MLRGIDAGKLDVRLTFESPTTAKDSKGEWQTTWSVYRSAMAQRIQKGSSERIEGRQQVGGDGADYKLRYDAGLTTVMRFKQSGEDTYFYIRDLQQWQREGYSFISAERRDNQDGTE